MRGLDRCTFTINKEEILKDLLFIYGGGRGIRTPVGKPQTVFKTASL